MRRPPLSHLLRKWDRLKTLLNKRCKQARRKLVAILSAKSEVVRVGQASVKSPLPLRERAFGRTISEVRPKGEAV